MKQPKKVSKHIKGRAYCVHGNPIEMECGGCMYDDIHTDTPNQDQSKCCPLCHCDSKCALKGAENCCHNGSCGCHSPKSSETSLEKLDRELDDAMKESDQSGWEEKWYALYPKDHENCRPCMGCDDKQIDFIRQLLLSQSNALKEEWKVDENTSDGYHTFKELYEFRKVYNAALFNEWAAQHKYAVHKSKLHSDGTEPFGGGWFIVQAHLPTGQISNHYELKDWDLFKCDEWPQADPWDGHTSKDVLDRLFHLLED